MDETPRLRADRIRSSRPGGLGHARPAEHGRTHGLASGHKCTPYDRSWVCMHLQPQQDRHIPRRLVRSLVLTTGFQRTVPFPYSGTRSIIPNPSLLRATRRARTTS